MSDRLRHDEKAEKKSPGGDSGSSPPGKKLFDEIYNPQDKSTGSQIPQSKGSETKAYSSPETKTAPADGADKESFVSKTGAPQTYEGGKSDSYQTDSKSTSTGPQAADAFGGETRKILNPSSEMLPSSYSDAGPDKSLRSQAPAQDGSYLKIDPINPYKAADAVASPRSDMPPPAKPSEGGSPERVAESPVKAHSDLQAESVRHANPLTEEPSRLPERAAPKVEPAAAATALREEARPVETRQVDKVPPPDAGDEARAQARTEPARLEPQTAEPQRPEPQRREPQRPEPQRPEPQRVEPARPEAAQPRQDIQILRQPEPDQPEKTRNLAGEAPRREPEPARLDSASRTPERRPEASPAPRADVRAEHVRPALDGRAAALPPLSHTKSEAQVQRPREGEGAETRTARSASFEPKKEAPARPEPASDKPPAPKGPQERPAESTRPEKPSMARSHEGQDRAPLDARPRDNRVEAPAAHEQRTAARVEPVAGQPPGKGDQVAVRRDPQLEDAHRAGKVETAQGRESTDRTTRVAGSEVAQGPVPGRRPQDTQPAGTDSTRAPANRPPDDAVPRPQKQDQPAGTRAPIQPNDANAGPRRGTAGATGSGDTGRTGRIPGAIDIDPTAGMRVTERAEGLPPKMVRPELADPDDKRYLIGPEIALAALIAAGGIARVRRPEGDHVPAPPPEAADQAGEAAEAVAFASEGTFDEPWFEEDDLPVAPVQAPVRNRPTYLISMQDTLNGLAERFYHDDRIGWLIADLNQGQTKETFVEGKRVIELRSRQSIVLPIWEDVEEFHAGPAREVEADRLVTIVVETAIDRELLDTWLQTVMGGDAERGGKPAADRALVEQPGAAAGPNQLIDKFADAIAQAVRASLTGGRS